MAASSRLERFAFAFALGVGASGCVLGSGEGEVTGYVSAPSCGLDGADPFDLKPNYFVAQEFDPGLDIRVQRGGDEIDYSNTLFVSVLDAEDVARNQIGVPLTLSDQLTSPVRMTLALNDTCPAHDRTSVPVTYSAVSGTITFTAIYASDVSSSRSIEATFSGVHFVDPSDPTRRYADLDGYFSFLYTRGRPAQAFP